MLFPFFSRFRIYVFFLSTLALAMGVATEARAQPAPGEAVGLVVFGEDLPREELRVGLERELGRAVVLLADSSRASGPFVTVTWRKERTELAVSYDEPRRGTVSRVVRARPLPSENVEDAILLASNLARNEADELLGKAPPPPTAPALAPTAPAPAPTAPAPAPLPRDYIPAYVAFFHPLASNFDRPYAKTRFGVDLPYGRAGELADGLQIGIVNAVIGKEGLASGDMSGVQVAFLGVNYVSGHASGVQVASAANVAGDGLEGGQVALLGNVSAGATSGAQASFVTNVSTGNMTGVQVSAVNVAADVHGFQAGFVNVAREVKGVTLGLVNVADDIEGVPIGVVSVTSTGGVHPVAWASSATFANVGVKFATKNTYTMAAVHYTVEGSADYAADGPRPALHLDSRQFVGGGYFLGGHVPFDSVFVDFDLGFSVLAAPSATTQTLADRSTRAYHEVLFEPRARVIGGYSFASHASLFFGAGLVVRARIVNDGDGSVIRALPEIFGGIQL